ILDVAQREVDVRVPRLLPGEEQVGRVDGESPRLELLLRVEERRVEVAVRMLLEQPVTLEVVRDRIEEDDRVAVGCHARKTSRATAPGRRRRTPPRRAWPSGHRRAAPPERVF